MVFVDINSSITNLDVQVREIWDAKIGIFRKKLFTVNKTNMWQLYQLIDREIFRNLM